MRALEDARWDWRTVDGVSRKTSIPRHEIQRFLSHSGRSVVRSVARDRKGRPLFTTRKRYREGRSLVERPLDHYRTAST